MSAPTTTELGSMLGNTGARDKSSILADLIASSSNKEITRAIVVGCGSGDDARAIAERFSCDVEAIDIDDYFVRGGPARIRFTKMDATELKFEDNSFDLAFSFHALEHIPNYRKAIEEIRRVLRRGGTYCIGTPNRTRAVGYVGVPGLSFRTKLAWNLVDWRQRLAGRFRNECGAHAGYTSAELRAICLSIGDGTDISDDYYRAVYPRYGNVLDLIVALHLQGIAWPSVYVLGNRN